MDKPHPRKGGPAAHSSPGVSPARLVALQALRDIDVNAAFAAQALEKALKAQELSKVDRSLATELVYGTTRRLNTLDHVLNQVLSRPLATLTPWVRGILRMGAYQLLYLSHIPAAAAVHEAVQLARRYGHEGVAKFVNGVLRAVDRLPDLPLPPREQDPVAQLALKHSHPEWIIRRWLPRYGEEATERLAELANATPLTTVRANLLKTDREGLRLALKAEGVAARDGYYHPQALVLYEYPSIGKLQSFRAGLCTVQDESSMLAATVLAPKPGSTVIDAAAGLGGKTTHLAELTEDRGKVIACDVHPHKLQLLREACRRLGIESVRPVQADARKLSEMLSERADYILVDAPCSGLGVLRRRPDARWRKEAERIGELVQLQVDILEGAAACLKPGGALVYSTCTLEPEENQGVVEQFLARHPDFIRSDLSPYLPPALHGEPGVTGGMLQLLPHVHHVDGFFIARLQRKP